MIKTPLSDVIACGCFPTRGCFHVLVGAGRRYKVGEAWLNPRAHEAIEVVKHSCFSVSYF